MVTDAGSDAPTAPRPAARTLARLVLPALLVGAAASLVLLGVSTLADHLQHLLWANLPGALGIGRWSAAWVLVVLTATGIAVGLLVARVPGHAGPDPATTALVDPPMPAGAVPGLLATGVLGLAGGVSLGPENPVTAANVALAHRFGRRVLPASPADLWIGLAAAGTIGALFGTPVAAALVLSETPAGRPGAGPLWDRLFGPLVAAGAGGLVTDLVARPTFALGLPPVHTPGWTGAAAALVIAPVGACVGLAAVYALPYAHRALHRIRRPLPRIGAGGLVLGLLGVLGGHLTLFKGLDEIRTLVQRPDQWSAGGLALMCVVKLAAVVVATSAGFRGGRIFPSLFAGVALGLCAHAAVPAVPPALGVVSAVLGVLMAVTRQGWLSLFTAAVLGADTTVLPLLCVASLPAWLVVTGRAQMQLRPDGTPVR